MKAAEGEGRVNGIGGEEVSRRPLSNTGIRLEDVAPVEKSATPAQPARVAAEQPSDKSREYLVAVPRIERGTRGL